ncbi:hypothetical protein RJ640_028256 [Escallonia rubra]|uniref:AAA+ ATPase domain-containing protein n=1 Tax=Escallonia rubra TaxID=112253 RepID=A0AA88U2D2_9ASTE|nr:hypothetical protein RJ640_028256 [Escallonia rubra]
MADIAVEYLLRKLEDWIFKETNKLRAAQVSKIKAEFEEIRPFLKYADWKMVITEDKKFEKWVLGVKDIACEVENVIDDDCYNRKETSEFSVSSLVALMGESFNYFLYGKAEVNPHPSIAFLQKRVTEKLKEVEVRKHISWFNSLNEGDDKHNWHLLSFTPKIHLNQMVGRDREVKMLKDWLLQDYVSTPCLIALTGSSGIGKTAVAETVYESVKMYFGCASRVLVSGRPNMDILKDMYMGFLQTPCSMIDEKDEKAMANRICRYLTGKNFLLVVDDLDSLDAWEDVKLALPMTGRGRILVTTRNSEFFTLPCKHVLHLDSLVPKDALALLHRSVCQQVYNLSEVLWPPSVEPVVEKILQISDSHPLVIAVLGGMLSTANFKEPREWDKVLSMLKETGECWPHFNMIEKVLLVSYFSLPPRLKCCFLYCGVFPSHYEIPFKRMIRILVAEGFIASQMLGMTEEEMAEKLLNELIQRNLIGVIKLGIDGEIISCRTIRLIQDFIIKMVRRDYFGVMSRSNQHIMPSNATRILAVHGVIPNTMSSFNTLNIRSLLLFGEGGFWDPSILLNSLSNIKFLRVLELQNSPIDALPDSVGDLVLLRYLSLRGTRICNLPSSIITLHELQTLDIRDTHVRALPGGFDGLKMLRHLLLSDSCSNRVVKLDGDIMFYKDLQTLAGIKLTQQVALGLKFLPQLLKLSVGEVEGRNSSHLSKSIDQMKNLSSLTIKCAWRKEIQIQTSSPPENLEKLRVGGWIKDLLGWVCTLKSLKYLYLQDCMLTNDPISGLQHLPSLIVVSLCKSYKGNHMICDDPAGFPKLKKLSLLNLQELEEWTKIEDGSMRNLETIIIAKSPKLKLLPYGLENLTNLRTLQIEDMPAEFVREARDTPLPAGAHLSVVR